MERSSQRILTTHVGSLIRPPELVAVLRRRLKGEAVPAEDFAAILDGAVERVVRQQRDIGLDIINDGEFGKSISWSRYVLERLAGFEQRLENRGEAAMPKSVFGKDRRNFAEFYAEYDKTQGLVAMGGWTVTGPITYRGQAALQEDIARLRRAAKDIDASEIFMCAVAPASVAPERVDRHYRDDEAYLYAVAEALRQEYRAIVDAGFILQIDDAYIAHSYDMIVPPGTLEDYRRWAAVRIEALNHALQGIPEERTRYHVCWGSWNGPHVSDIGFEQIADLVLKVRVGGYSIEMANPRHEHEWRVWERVKLPAGRILLPGVISHTTNIVEHPELVAERITRLAALVGRENVIASTDCGFAQGPFVQRVHPSIMWAKLEALAAGARLASAALWERRAA